MPTMGEAHAAADRPVAYRFTAGRLRSNFPPEAANLVGEQSWSATGYSGNSAAADKVSVRRYHGKSTVMTSNKPFSECRRCLAAPGASARSSIASCTRVEIVKIDGQSYRQREAMERAERLAWERRQRRKQRNST